MSKTGKECRLNSLFSVMLEELNLDPKRTEEIQFAKGRLSERMRKRARVSKPELEQEAYSRFLAINHQVRDFNVCLDPQLARDARHYITVMLERQNTRWDDSNIQVTLDMSYLLDSWRFGPGASNGIRGTHTADKIYQDMTCTAPSEPFVVMLRRSNPYFQAYDSLRGVSGMSRVNGSKLATVPKNETTVRTIAIEPSGNMCLQLAAGRVLEDALRSTGLDIRNQQLKNKLLAREGSISDSLATIDLKSASDMISIELVRALFPSDWVDLLLQLRSPQIQLPDGTWHELYMISTMGNGFTFPLMTFIIQALLYAFRASRNGPNLFIDWSKTAIFGDDIIIPSSEYNGFCKVLESAGFVVNHDKSYSSGPFRESCGGDYFKGYDVTPFYVKQLDSDADIFVAINQLLEWSGRHKIMLPRTLLLMKSYLNGKAHLVPEWSQPYSGIKTALCRKRYKHLAVKQQFQKLRNSFFALPLAAGGYVSSSSSLDIFYLPRPYKTRYRVESSRLPNGYLDGRDFLFPADVSTHITLTLSLLFEDVVDGA